MLKVSWKVIIIVIIIWWSNLATASNHVAKPGCPTKCGNINILYPFGVGLDGACSLSSPAYDINCNTSFDPPKPFLGWGNLEVMDISGNGQMRLRTLVSTRCYQGGKIAGPNNSSNSMVQVGSLPIVFSETANKLFLVGCDELVLVKGLSGRSFRSGCITVCSNPEDVLNGSCSGIGCCQTSIPRGVRTYLNSVRSLTNHTNVSHFNPCGYSFLAEDGKYTFNSADLSDPMFLSRVKELPTVLEWYVGSNQSCRQAKANETTYVCQQNTKCTDFDDNQGYRCSCLPGYQGNPYLHPGCADINECVGSSQPCSHICTNTVGSFICSCPKGHRGDGLKNGTRCTSDHSQFAMRFSLGMSFGFLFLVTIFLWIYFTIRRKRLMKKRKKFFEQNGGLLLNQQLFENGESIETSKIFSADELKAATDNYNDDRILGKGGYGTVYKGILSDNREVAIKKSKVADESQVEQFINEVIILTQINHRNVVKLLGCCLETEVPLLVYEFISNGTLFEHIHGNRGISSWLTWENCVKLATEVVDALAYLHSAVSIPIIHRDVKSTNILLDENYTAKISDFGASRLVPIDQTQVTTLVQGTLGYLDPEYFQTSQLTEKSDVYSFGVVLVELLVKEKPLSMERAMEERNLASYFVLARKEDRLMEILDPQLVREAAEEKLVKMAKLAKKCLNVKGENRPTMKEVAIELQVLRKKNTHPWINMEQKFEETTSLMGEHDLYPIPSSDRNGNNNPIEFSRQYLMEMSLKSEANYPR